MIVKRLIDSQWVICATQNYLNKYGTPQTPAQLQNHDCLIYKFDNTSSDLWPLYEDGAELLLPVYGRFYSNHLSAIKHAALSDLGIAFLPQALVYNALQEQRLTQILQPFTRKRMGMYAVYPKARQPDQKLKQLVAYLQDALKDKEAYYC